MGPSVRLGLITGVSGFVLLLISTTIALAVDSTTTAVVMRAALVTMLLVLTVRAMAPHLHGPDGRQGIATVAAGLLLGYALALGWWGGHAYIAQVALDNAAGRAVIDGALWLLVGLGADRRYARAALTQDLTG